MRQPEDEERPGRFDAGRRGEDAPGSGSYGEPRRKSTPTVRYTTRRHWKRPEDEK